MKAAARALDRTEVGTGAGRTHDEAWDRVRARLKAELGEEVFTSWFARVTLEDVSGGVVRLSAPTRFLKSWILSHYRDRLTALWGEEQPGALRVDVEERSALRARAVSHAAPANVARAAIPVVEGEERFEGSPLDRRLTFETFCEGRSNDVASRAARAVAARPADASPMYNPLYIHAGVGLGKTHLLQAVAHMAGDPASGQRVFYLTAERFMFQFVQALRDKSALDFKAFLRGIDVMLIDDMQFLTGRAVQQEFCHMLNALLDSGAQVVVAADRPPSDLESLDERARSRLAGGVVVGMSVPDARMRRSILDQRLDVARTRNPAIDVPEPVLDFVARVISSSGRDLDGALNRLVCRAELADEPITLAVAEQALADLIGKREPRPVMIEDIQRIVARHYNVSKADLLSSRRTRTVVRPRQVAMFLAKSLTPRSLPEIGRRFGGRDHTTVLHAVRKIESLSRDDQTLAEEIELLKLMIQE